MNRNLDVGHIVSLLKNVLKKKDGLIPLHQPTFRGKEWAYVKDCLDTGWVSSVGKYVGAFEKKLAEYTGVEHAIAVVNGTAAMHICLKLAGVEEGDEVLLPALTFVATANAVRYCGGIPHFVDSDWKSLGIDPKKLQDYLKDITLIRQGCCYNKQTMRPIKAVVAVHTFGHPVDLDPILAICEKYKLVLIEDAAEALGSYYKDKHTGNWGKLSAFSFNGNKIITTGGGGAILTNDLILAKTAKHLTTTAKVPHPWAFVHDEVGYNYRLPNINAALGCGQIEVIDEFIQEKRTLAQKYRQVFKEVQGITFFTEAAYARSNYWLNLLLLDEEYVGLRDPLLLATHEEGILTRPSWSLMHKLAMFKECPRMDLSAAQDLEQRIINIPSSVGLGEK
ncbi:LegC family aminotransferase [Clostridium formicaceticum]|uniref:Aminotransferase DegT n=1 Tax=Clostridium formicaceticum TaxID=1497 RepID=A0AAC9RP90_9CLOT|nr:LegC family aminotransferase [Clostridium formicaceticum]AOY78163.1 aminotransferase DegT [Clostridium formicaceticum]ARE88818.1 Putative pyridoxal phosphate-dependent aminotransferase EpsN [Clostridium formicaceticum]